MKRQAFQYRAMLNSSHGDGSIAAFCPAATYSQLVRRWVNVNPLMGKGNYAILYSPLKMVDAENTEEKKKKKQA